MPHFFGYGRASLDSQAYTVPVQEERLHRLWQGLVMDEQGVTWGGMFSDESTSSKVPLVERKAGYALNLRLEQGDHVGMTKLDRAFRNMREAVNQMEDWIERGVTVHVLDFGVNTKTEAGRMVIRILAAVAEFERALIRERTRAVVNSPKVKAKLLARKERGKLGHRAPIGYRAVGAARRKVLVEDAHEQKCIDLIVEWRDGEGLNWSQIARRLMYQKLFTREGKLWHLSRIFRAYHGRKRRSNGPLAASSPTPVTPAGDSTSTPLPPIGPGRSSSSPA
jgi:DNA invertase Pin-like site-specific DNA recombinase